jgi:putative nucleotidyltransferase with HDIG domain
MGSRGLNRYLPHVAVATFGVIGVPALAVWVAEVGLGLPGVVAIPMAVGLSMALASAGARLWMRHSGSRDLVFGDLMVWGWLRRAHSERRLAEAARLLGQGDLSAGEHARVLRRLAGSLEARDLYTFGHSRRVARHAERIARGIGLRGDDLAKVRTAAAVHDVGKVFTPREVLTKPGRLTDVEFEVIKRHAADGADMVAELGDRDVMAMVRHHHERLDGSGYPDGVLGAQIPLGARIIAVADTFDAMTSTRPYRPARSHKQAMDVLVAEAGTKLDAGAVAAFRGYYARPWPVALSSLLVTLPQRLASWVGGALQGGAATLGTAALIGGGPMAGPGAAEQPQPNALRPAIAGELAPPGSGERARPSAAAPSTARAGRAGGRGGVGTRPRHNPGFWPRARGRAFGTPQAPTPSPSQPGRPAQADRPSKSPTPGPPLTSADPEVPEVSHIPPIKTPLIETPAIKTPPVNGAPLHVPGVEVPGVRVPEVRLPGAQVPGINGP